MNNITPPYLMEEYQQHEAEFIRLILHRLGITINPYNKELHYVVLSACEKFNCMPSKYLEGLKNCTKDSPFMEYLVAGITIGETYFFRDNHQTQLLSTKVLPSLIENKRNKGQLSLRIWSAGCSSGEEIYTITMMLYELLPDIDQWALHLLGTDINTKAFQKARLGRYNKWSMRNIPTYFKERYFSENANQYILSSKIKDRVKFSYLNLNENTYPSIINTTNAQDLVICRNVLIYFKQENINELMKKIALSLAEDGYLLLGASDPVCIDNTDLVFHHHEGMLFSRKSGIEPLVRSPNPIDNHQFYLQTILNQSISQETKKEPAFILSKKAKEAADLGQLEKAEKFYQDSLLLDSTNKETYFIYSFVLLALSRLEEAEQVLRKALFLDRKYIEAHCQLGLLLVRTKRLKEGLKSLRNALNIVSVINPSNLVPGAEPMSYGRFAELLKVEINHYVLMGEKGAGNEK